jgi:hypothetical protein
MRLISSAIAVLFILPLIASAGEVYSYTDEEGVTVITDRPPPEASDLPKTIVNEHGVPVGAIEGKKTEEQIEQERLAKELAAQRELQNRADQALLNTYISVDEIIMHRDRRVELFQAQARVTELYLRNSERRLKSLERDARRYKPYSSDPNAPMIDEGLLQDIRDTKKTIQRQETNLEKYRNSQQEIIANFAGDIARFKKLKGIED